MDAYRMKPGRCLCAVSSLFFLASIQACSQPSPQVINPPCVTRNATIQMKPSVDLSLMFGDEAIQTAVDAMTRHIGQKDLTSATELTRVGTDAAVRAAEGNGKNLKPQNKAVLEAYFRENVIPTIIQNPTCLFKVSASSQPEVTIEAVYLENIGDQQIAKVKIANTGQQGARFIHVVLRSIIEGMKPLSGQTEMVLDPGQWRNVSNPQARFPMSAIGFGKKKLIVFVQVSFAKEAGTQPIVYQEEWAYDPPSQTFKQSIMK
jgi:hypothetical protein